jgi:hypothetical protein
MVRDCVKGFVMLLMVDDSAVVSMLFAKLDFCRFCKICALRFAVFVAVNFWLTMNWFFPMKFSAM